MMKDIPYRRVIGQMEAPAVWLGPTRSRLGVSLSFRCRDPYALSNLCRPLQVVFIGLLVVGGMGMEDWILRKFWR